MLLVTLYQESYCLVEGVNQGVDKKKTLLLTFQEKLHHRQAALVWTQMVLHSVCTQTSRGQLCRQPRLVSKQGVPRLPAQLQLLVG